MDGSFSYITWFGSIAVLLPAGLTLIVLFRKAFQYSDMCLILGALQVLFFQAGGRFLLLTAAGISILLWATALVLESWRVVRLIMH